MEAKRHLLIIRGSNLKNGYLGFICIGMGNNYLFKKYLRYFFLLFLDLANGEQLNKIIGIYDGNIFLKMWILNIKLKNYRSYKRPKDNIKIIIMVGKEDHHLQNLKTSKNVLWDKITIVSYETI